MSRLRLIRAAALVFALFYVGFYMHSVLTLRVSVFLTLENNYFVFSDPDVGSSSPLITRAQRAGAWIANTNVLLHNCSKCVHYAMVFLGRTSV